MNRFVVIVLSDRREDSDAVVSAVSALGRDKEAEESATIAQLAGEREYAVASAAAQASAQATEQHRRGIGFFKIKDKLDAGETKTITVYRSRAFMATSFQVEAECAGFFTIDEIRYAEPGMGPGIPNKTVDFRGSSNPVPAAVFSDEGSAPPLMAFECTSVAITVSNTSKKPRTFRARMLGFYKDRMPTNAPSAQAVPSMVPIDNTDPNGFEFFGPYDPLPR